MAEFTQQPDPARPRLIEIDLERAAGVGALGAAARQRAWSSDDPALDRVGRWSGAALALALLEERARAGREPGLVIAVGECVRRGLPTAARATIASRAPLTGRLADGQVGGDLARRLAHEVDALSISGATDVRGAVLVLRAGAEPRLESRPELVGASPRATDVALRAAHGDVATLSVGPAGERADPIASLVAGGDPPHFVGRGGLGAVLGRAGLKALVIDAPLVELTPELELSAALLDSPRLDARARAGTLELFDALAARDEARLGGARGERGSEAARAVGAELDARRETRHGCKGCPTPCGWVFSAGPGMRGQAARFGATRALGIELGLEHAEQALGLLARCDELGVDAKEVGLGLRLLCEARARGRLAGGDAWGDRVQLEAWLAELASGTGEGALLAGGARALAREHRLEHVLEEADAQRAARRDLAALLGAAVSSRGADPMRTFPFLVHDGVERTRLERVLAPLELPAHAEDARRPEGKGRLVWWHENLSAALDATGFCSFSAAALLADGRVELEQLARWIAPRALLADSDAAARLLEMGSALVHLARRLDERWDGRGDLARLGAGRAALEHPGAWPEYARLRGLDARGLLLETQRRRFDAQAADAPAQGLVGPPPAPPVALQPAPADVPRRPGRVILRAGGPLAEALGAERALELDLPCSLGEVLAAAARAGGAAAQRILAEGRVPPAAYRAGLRVAPEQEVRDGDRIDLVLVISGGAR